MSKHLVAAKHLADLILGMEGHFDASSRDIKLDVVDDVGLVFSLNKTTQWLGNHKWSDSDFNCFCKQNELTGVIFFNTDGTVTFSMSPIKG